MSMRLTTRKQGDVTIVHAAGKPTLGEGTNAFRAKMKELVDSDARRIILNMSDVAYIDSSGIGELVAAVA